MITGDDLLWAVPAAIVVFLIGANLLHRLYMAKKLRRLRAHGKAYKAEIVRLTDTHRDRRGSQSSTTRVECVYKDDRGHSHVVKGGLVRLELGQGAESLSAMIYVNKENHKDYAVDISKPGTF